jgi:ADP-heptose:LPS heptosyltransferase
LSGAALYLGNDSGITHLAAACGVRTMAIFRASDPRVWAPRGTGVRVLVRPEATEVMEACRELLSTAG